MTTPFVVGVWMLSGALTGAILSLWTRRALRLQPTRLARAVGSATTGATVTALLFGTLAWRLGSGFELLLYSALAAFSVPLSIVDSLERRLPNKLLVAVFLVLALLACGYSVLHWDVSSLARGVAGAVTTFAFYLVLALALPGGLGSGDVKLGGVLGLALGWTGWTAVIGGMFFGWLLAALGVLALRATGRASKESMLPMCPFLVLGSLVAAGLTASH
jgi:leader peptidase (prepilin peptidase) / N-methyltransferase